MEGAYKKLELAQSAQNAFLNQVKPVYKAHGAWLAQAQVLRSTLLARRTILENIAKLHQKMIDRKSIEFDEALTYLNTEIKAAAALENDLTKKIEAKNKEAAAAAIK